MHKRRNTEAMRFFEIYLHEKTLKSLVFEQVCTKFMCAR